MVGKSKAVMTRVDFASPEDYDNVIKRDHLRENRWVNASHCFDGSLIFHEHWKADYFLSDEMHLYEIITIATPQRYCHRI